MAPFIAAHSEWFGGGAELAASRQLYLWATGVVAAYAFELGDDKFQVCYCLTMASP